MKKYTDEELLCNYEKFMSMLSDNFEGTRLYKLEKMYDEEALGGRLILAPASGKVFRHNAYPGGYIDHVFNVVKAVQAAKILYLKMGGIVDFTDEEMMFAAIHHDLGKLGDENFEYYVPEGSAWHWENQGSRFKLNPEIQFMKVPDRALYILNHFEIPVTQSEWLGIKLSDGTYEKANHAYLIAYSKEQSLKTRLPYLIHWADHMAVVTESCYNDE